MRGASALAQGRRAALSRMSSRAKVGRRDGSSKVDGLKVATWATVATTPFRLQAPEGAAKSVTIGDVTYDSASAVAHFPADLHDLCVDDVLEVTVGEWAGTFWRIVAATMKDQATARRVPIVQVARPAGWV